MCKDGPAAGMMVVFGGRTAENKSLKDTWGLRQHRDGRWDWVEAPAKRGPPPEPRHHAFHCFSVDSSFSSLLIHIKNNIYILIIYIYLFAFFFF